MELVVNKYGVVSESGSIPDDVYEHEKETAVTLISLSIIRKLYENSLLNKQEYEYISEKYKACM
jgi:hypothetical protein